MGAANNEQSVFCPESPKDLADSLRADIVSGKLSTGARLQTDVQLARDTGLSRLAVRAAYEVLVREGLVVRSPRNGTFVRSRSSVIQKAEGIGSLFLLGWQLGYPGLAKERYWPGRGLIGLEGAALAHKDTWIYATGNTNASPGEMIPETVNMEMVQGVVSYGLQSEAERENLAGYLEAMGKPHVALNEHFTSHGTNCVVEDCRSGMKALIERVVELGHYDTVFCTSETPYTIYPARLKAYEAAARAAGLPLYAPIISPARPGEVSLQAQGEIIGRQIIGMRHRPTTVICAADFLALGVMEFLQAQGVKIPQEMSITGYDDHPAAEAASPPLTTVNQDLAIVGEEAVHCLHRMIEDKDYRGVSVDIPVAPVFRESLGPAPGPYGAALPSSAI